MQDIDTDISRKLANMAFLCSLFVVIIHVLMPDQVGSAAWWLLKLTSFRCIAVPFFFLMSGYLLAGHIGECDWWRRECQKRVRSLLVPYVLWSALLLLLYLAEQLVWNLHHGAGVMSSFDLYLGDHAILGLDLFTSPQLAVLWYVRTLMFFVVLSPLIFKALKRNAKLVLGLSLLAFLVKANVDFGTYRYFLYRTLGLDMVFFFMLGMSLRKQLIAPFTRRPVAVVGILAVALQLAMCFTKAYGGLEEWSPVARFAFSLTGGPHTLLWMYFIWMVMPAKPLPRMLQNTSFAIYLVHPFVLNGFWYRYAYMAPGGAVDLIVNILVGIFGTLAIVLCLKWFLPKTSAVLFGGRS